MATWVSTCKTKTCSSDTRTCRPVEFQALPKTEQITGRGRQLALDFSIEFFQSELVCSFNRRTKASHTSELKSLDCTAWLCVWSCGVLLYEQNWDCRGIGPVFFYLSLLVFDTVMKQGNQKTSRNNDFFSGPFFRWVGSLFFIEISNGFSTIVLWFRLYLDQRI